VSSDSSGLRSATTVFHRESTSGRRNSRGPIDFYQAGPGGAIEAAGGASAAALSDRGAWPTADRAGADAADLIPTALVCSPRRGAGACALRQPSPAWLCRRGSRDRRGFRGDGAAEVPALSGMPGKSAAFRDEGACRVDVAFGSRTPWSAPPLIKTDITRFGALRPDRGRRSGRRSIRRQRIALAAL
jgi:hypothetical protein